MLKCYILIFILIYILLFKYIYDNLVKSKETFIDTVKNICNIRQKLNLEPCLKDLQGDKNTFFCGAYHGYGFHEDGIQSAVYVSKMLGADIPWKRDNNFYNRLLY